MRMSALIVCMALLVACSGQESDSATQNDVVQKNGVEKNVVQEEITMDAVNETNILEIGFNTIEGQPTKLADFTGDVILVVNVASECGYTPQYEGLQKLYEKYSERGLTVVGFPANNFGGQEPGSDEEIQRFCTDNFSVTFPMMSKVSVKGDDQHALFANLTTHSDPSGDISWNFHKFLLDREGKIVARYKSDVTPLSEELTDKIESLL